MPITLVKAELNGSDSHWPRTQDRPRPKRLSRSPTLIPDLEQRPQWWVPQNNIDNHESVSYCQQSVALSLFTISLHIVEGYRAFNHMHTYTSTQCDSYKSATEDAAVRQNTQLFCHIDQANHF